MTRNIIVVDTEDDVIEKLCSKIEIIAGQAIKENGTFHIGLSGGSLVGYLSRGLPKITTEWNKWILFFCDERIVPFGEQDSTFGAYSKAFCGNGPLTDEQFVVIDPALDAKSAAEDYTNKLKAKFPTTTDFPKFDVLLLGMGPDGHTCSLFPEHPLLKVDDVWVAPISDSPKPPPARVTFTYPVINNALNCFFAIAGQGKADMAKRILSDNEQLPAGLVNPLHGEVTWILDSAAASLLQKD